MDYGLWTMDDGRWTMDDGTTVTQHFLSRILVTQKTVVQSNPVNTDTEGTMDIVRINGVSVLSGLCKLSQKYTFYWRKISKDIKQNINTSKLNVYNVQSSHSSVAKSHDENSETETVLLSKECTISS